MYDMGAFSTIIDAADTHGDALVVYDNDDRVTFANGQHRDLYPEIDFDRHPSFADIFWHCVETGKFHHPRVYADPEAWLADTQQRRHVSPALRFLRRHRNGQVFVIRNVKVDGLGSYQTRTMLSPDMVTGIDEFGGAGKTLDPANRDPADELAAMRSRVTEMTSALDAWRVPCALVEGTGELRHFNYAMGLLLDCEDGLRIRPPKLVADHAADHRKLQETIRRYAKARTGLGVATMRVRRLSDRPPYVVSVNATAPGANPQPDVETGSALVLVADPDAGCMVDSGTLRRLYGLSEFEADLATRLVRSETLAEIALTLGKPVEVVRACVREVMDRMGVEGPIDFTQRMADIAEIITPYRSPGW